MSPSQGNGSLCYSITHCSPIGSQRHIKAVFATTNLEEITPSAKKGKSEGEERMTPMNTKQREETISHTRNKGAILEIDVLAPMWLNYPIHEAFAQERGKKTIAR